MGNRWKTLAIVGLFLLGIVTAVGTAAPGATAPRAASAETAPMEFRADNAKIWYVWYRFPGQRREQAVGPYNRKDALDVADDYRRSGASAYISRDNGARPKKK